MFFVVFFFLAHIFAFFSIETQSANIELSKNKVPKKTTSKMEKKRKKQN